ncbi:MAG: hypothetical protein LBI06_00055, partial [Treponema sp.]|nr:hypothetical protein [Treponema sp.]
MSSLSNKKICLIPVILFFVSIAGIHAEENDFGTGSIGITKSFGSFSIPGNWVEITRYSRNGKYFYSHESEPIGLRMTNISIEIGSNPYPLEDHMTFRYAILQQLLMQARGSQVGGSGTFTENGDPLYIFTVEDKKENITTIQYYIVGNRRHILIHVTDFHNENITNAE